VVTAAMVKAELHQANATSGWMPTITSRRRAGLVMCRGVAQRPRCERVHDVQRRDVDDHAARTVLAELAISASRSGSDRCP